MQTHDQLLADAMNDYAMAHHHLTKLKGVLDQMMATRSSGLPTISPVRCVREWQDWLASHGPSLKGDIHEGTGVKFTERGSKYTFDWSPSLADAPDAQFTPNTLMKISAKADGRGAPPKIYFLWSQRWDVFPKFGVGPIKPDDLPADISIPTDGAMRGMVLIPSAFVQEDGITIKSKPVYEPVDNFMEELNEVLSHPVRYATMADWDDAWAATFDSLAAAEAKPSDVVKQQMRETLPEGADGNAAIAIAYREATLRAREDSSTLLGVVMPPAPSQAQAPLDWADQIDDLRSGH